VQTTITYSNTSLKYAVNFNSFWVSYIPRRLRDQLILNDLSLVFID